MMRKKLMCLLFMMSLSIVLEPMVNVPLEREATRDFAINTTSPPHMAWEATVPDQTVSISIHSVPEGLLQPQGDFFWMDSNNIASENGALYVNISMTGDLNAGYRPLLQLYGRHNINGVLSTIAHGVELELTDILNPSTYSTSIENPSFFFSSGDQIMKRLDGCYWYSVKIESVRYPTREYYNVFESKKVNFSPNNLDYCTGDIQTLSDTDQDGWSDQSENSTLNYSYWNDQTLIPLMDSDGDGVPNHLDVCSGTPLESFVNASGCPFTPSGTPPLQQMNAEQMTLQIAEQRLFWSLEV